MNNLALARAIPDVAPVITVTLFSTFLISKKRYMV